MKPKPIDKVKDKPVNDKSRYRLLLAFILVLIVLFAILFKFKNKREHLDLVEYVNIWNESLVKQDYVKLEEIYSDNVHYYGKAVLKAELIQRKKEVLEQVNFYQECRNISEIKINDLTIKAEFDKFYKFSSSSKLKHIKASLVFGLVDNKWLIVSESDIKVDNLKK